VRSFVARRYDKNGIDMRRAVLRRFIWAMRFRRGGKDNAQGRGSIGAKGRRCKEKGASQRERGGGRGADNVKKGADVSSDD